VWAAFCGIFMPKYSKKRTLYGRNLTINELEKFEKYLEYYNLCEDGREVLSEAAKKICADENMLSEALKIKNKIANISFDSTNPDEIYSAVNEEFKDKSAQFGAFVYTLAIEDMEKLYKEKMIPRDILIATITELSISINQHHEEGNEWGFDGYSWLIHHLRGRMFRLGRLVFEIAYIIDWHLTPTALQIGLKMGDPFLSVHIPRGGRLDESACFESFEIAKEFFPKVLNFDFKAFGCFSWLFDPAFGKLLLSDSNILKFQSLFTVTRYWENYDGLDHVFVNITKDNIKDAPTDTRLRKKLVEYVLSDGIMQCGGGFRLREGNNVR